jgi:UDP-glucose:(glucosyl)LPS beta-1,3-glucosyltransferase
MVSRLSNASSEFAMVRTMERFVDEETLDELYIVGQNAKEEENETLFEDCLFAKNGFFWGAGAYMLRTSALKSTTNYDIYTAKDAGQNWQLFLPIL